MPDGMLLHLRDTYPIETAWAPQYVGDELRQVRAAVRDTRLATIRASAEAAAAGTRGDHDTARQQELAASYQALHGAYRQRGTVFAAVMADRADWDAATRTQRHLAAAADAELRRRPRPAPPAAALGRTPARHPGPARRAHPTPGKPPGEMAQWIEDLAAARARSRSGSPTG
jgi:hypothetical protein